MVSDADNLIVSLQVQRVLVLENMSVILCQGWVFRLCPSEVSIREFERSKMNECKRCSCRATLCGYCKMTCAFTIIPPSRSLCIQHD